MSAGDNKGTGSASVVDSGADTVDIADASADPVAAVKTLGKEASANQPNHATPASDGGTSSGTDSTVMAPTGMSDGHSSVESSGAISASFPTADARRYEVNGEHARGGLGRILHAHDRRLNRPVAIKELLRAGDGAEARFLREAVVTARLEHPSIVPVHDMGRWSSGSPFYAMKMVSGSSLEQRIKEGKTIEDRLALLPNLVAVVDAMAYAHSKGVIHRDLKPSNVVVGPFGETIVIDWGLAKDSELADELNTVDPAVQAVAEGLTVVGAVMGTPAYMPPEQAAGETVDERADVYALGAMLYHLLTGAAPYAGKASQKILEMVSTGPPQPIDTKTLEAPVELVAICDKAMARDPADRYPSAQKLVDDLKRFQMGQLVTAHAYSTWSHVRRWLARYRAPVAVAGIGMLVLIVVGVISVRRIVAEKRTAQQQSVLAEKQRNSADTQRGVAERRTVALLEEQGRRELLADRPLRALVYLSRAYSDGANSPRIRRLIRDGMRQLDSLHAVFRGHKRSISGLAWSPDGKVVVTSSGDKTVRVWDVASKKQIGELIGHSKAVDRLAFSPDGKRIITAGKDGVSRVWDATTFKTIVTLDGHKNGVQVARFSPRGDRYLTAGNDWTAKLWTTDGKLAATLKSSGPIVQDAVFDASGDKVLTVGMRGAQLWEVKTGKLVHAFAGHAQVVFHAAISGDGSRVVTTTFAGEIKLWDANTGKLLATRHGKSAVQHARFSPDSKTLVTVGRRGHAVIWDAGNAKREHTLPHVRDVWSIAFSPDGRRLVTACDDGAARLWDSTTGGLIARLPGQRKAVRRVAFSPDGTFIASAADDGQVRVWKTSGWKLKHTMDKAAGTVEFDQSGARLVATGRSGRAHVWDAHTFKLIATLDGRPKQKIGSTTLASGMTPKQARQAIRNTFLMRSLVLRGASFSPDGKRVVTVTGDPVVRIWQPKTGELLHRLNGHRGSLMAVAFSPDSTMLASASGDSTIGLWDIVKGRPLRLLKPGKNETVSAVVFSPDGEWLASAGTDKLVTIWRVTTGELIRKLSGHTRKINTLEYSADGKFLVTSSEDGTASVWEASTGARVTTLRHRKRVRSARFSRDGELVVTGSSDHTAKLWSRSSGAMVASFDGHTGEVNKALFSPDHKVVATISMDGTAKIWDAQAGQLLATMDGHNVSVSAAAFHPASNILVTVSKDGATMVWDVSAERRGPKEIAAMVDRLVPWRLHRGRLMPKD